MDENKPGAFIFDMDGLMLDTEPIYRLAWQRASKEVGFPIDDELYFDLIGRNNRDGEAILVRTFGEEFPLPEFRKLWDRHWRQYVTENGIPPKPGLLELLNDLERLGIPKAVATSTDRETAGSCLRMAGLAETRFQCVVAGDEIEKGKPAPDIYLDVAARLGVPPERCIVLEDSESGVIAGCSAGMLTIMVPDMKQPSERVAALAYRVLPSLHEVRELIRDRWTPN